MGVTNCRSWFGSGLLKGCDRHFRLWQRGIRVSSTIDAQRRLVADLTPALILSGLHRIPYYVRQQLGGGPMNQMIDAQLVPQRCLIG